MHGHKAHSSSLPSHQGPHGLPSDYKQTREQVHEKRNQLHHLLNDKVSMCLMPAANLTLACGLTGSPNTPRGANVAPTPYHREPSAGNNEAACPILATVLFMFALTAFLSLMVKETKIKFHQHRKSRVSMLWPRLPQATSLDQFPAWNKYHGPRHLPMDPLGHGTAAGCPNLVCGHQMPASNALGHPL